MKRLRVGASRGGMVLVAVLLSCSSFVGLVRAAPGADRSAPVVTSAQFEGQLLRLAGDWGAARACLIWQQAGVNECFRSVEEMDHRVAAIAEAQVRGRSYRMLAACSSYLRLYEHTNFGGRVLQFADRGYWQNLGNWGFNDQLSSYKVGGCGVNLAEHANGGGYWYPGNTGPYAQSSCMCAGSTKWNDRVSSIYIK